MKTYTMLYEDHNGESHSKTLHFHNDIIAMIEAPMFAIRYRCWLLMDECHNCITRFMPTWGDAQVVNNI
jgi:hypothetical protein